MLNNIKLAYENAIAKNSPEAVFLCYVYNKASQVDNVEDYINYLEHEATEMKEKANQQKDDLYRLFAISNQRLLRKIRLNLD